MDAAPVRGTGSVADAWRINARVTALLVGALPPEVWPLPLPGSPRRSVGALAAHLHNTRRLWLKALGPAHGIPLPAPVPPRAATHPQVLAALAASEAAIEHLLRAGIAAGGRFPGRGGPFVFGAIPRDAALFVAYAVAHESHHRGQLVSAARILGHRLPREVLAGLWQWSSRLREARS